MSCLICGCTMHSLPAMPGGLMTWWCPRCGTLLSTSDAPGATVHHDVPKLVERCRAFEDDLFKCSDLDGDIRPSWSNTGIAESIHRPEDRP